MQANEIMLFILGAFTLIFLIASRASLRGEIGLRFLIIGFVIQVASWLFTNLEALLLPNFFNVLEHLFDLANSVFILAWCYVTFRRREARP